MGIILAAAYGAFGLILVIFSAIPIKIHLRSQAILLHWMWGRLSGLFFIIASILFFAQKFEVVKNWSLLIGLILLLVGLVSHTKSEFLNDYPKRTRLHSRVLRKLFSEPGEN